MTRHTAEIRPLTRPRGIVLHSRRPDAAAILAMLTRLDPGFDMARSGEALRRFRPLPRVANDVPHLPVVAGRRAGAIIDRLAENARGAQADLSLRRGRVAVSFRLMGRERGVTSV